MTCVFCLGTHGDITPRPLSTGVSVPAHAGCAMDFEHERDKDRRDQ